MFVLLLLLLWATGHLWDAVALAGIFVMTCVCLFALVLIFAAVASCFYEAQG